MKSRYLGAAASIAVLVAGCGGGNDSSAVAPPTGQNPPPAVATTDFNLFAIAMVTQTSSSADTFEPVSLEPYTFVFDEREGVFDNVLPR
jgi:hypothetical protein